MDAVNPFDIDYLEQAMPDEQPRKLTAIEWEAKLREEDRATHQGRRRGRGKAQAPLEDEPVKEPSKNSRFGSFSGAGEEPVEGQQSTIKSADKKTNIKLPWTKSDKAED